MCNILLRARAKFIECIKTEELRCAIMTIKSERKVYAMHKNERIDPICKHDGGEYAQGVRNTQKKKNRA